MGGQTLKTVYYAPTFKYSSGKPVQAFEENWAAKEHFFAFQFLDDTTVAFQSRGVDLDNSERLSRRGCNTGLGLGVVAMAALSQLGF